MASANYLATSWYISTKADIADLRSDICRSEAPLHNAVLIDVGSTTTDIIPIKDGSIACGRTDLERLQSGELLYTGALRTNVASIVNSVLVNGTPTMVSSELFSTTADVYLILGDIKEKEYKVETADGRGKSIEECMARLARVVCADLNILSEKDIIKIAEYIKEEQIKQISRGIKKVLNKGDLDKNITAFITGVGSFLGRDAAKKVNIEWVEIDVDPSTALGDFIISLEK